MSDPCNTSVARDIWTGVETDLVETSVTQAPRPTSFEELVAATADRMLRTAVLLTGDRHAAEDLVQSTFAQVFARWRLVERAENPVAYTRTILTRQFLSDRRRRRPLRFTPAGGRPTTSLFLNVQPVPRTEVPADVTCGGDYERYADCVVTTLPAGDVLRTYVDVGSESPDYVRRVAEVRSPARGLRVIVASSNTLDGETGIAGVEPGLSVAQLTEVVTQPWWQLRRLPVEYVEAGERLAPYRDQGASRG